MSETAGVKNYCIPTFITLVEANIIFVLLYPYQFIN